MTFSDIYKNVLNNTLVSKDRFESIHNLCKQVASLNGSAVEVGVYKGGTAYMISRTLPTTNCYFFDTFEGLPKTDKSIDLHNEKDFNDVNEDDVRSFLKADNVEVTKGFFPATAGNIEDKTFKFVHIDVDLYKGTLDCLEFFYPRMEKGGVIVTDDYKWRATPGVTKAFDEFFKDKPEKIVESTTSQAYVVKQ